MHDRSSLQFVLLGCGDFGQYLGRYLLEVGQIAAICDTDAERARQTAAALKLNVPIDMDYHQAVRRPGLDAAVVTAANFVHCDMTCAAAAAGLHVFCEKAMARNAQECRQMVQVCIQHHVKLMVGHKRRLRPSWARMIELTDQTLLGQPLALSVTQYTDRRPEEFPGWWSDPQTSGGTFALLGVHVIDWFAAMCGTPKQVCAVNGVQMDQRYKFPDIVHAIYQFESGAVASLSTSFAYPLHPFHQAQGPMVQCRHGGLKLVPQQEYIDLYWQRLDEEQPHQERFDFAVDVDTAYRREVTDFAHWITEDRPPCLTWREGLRCVQMMDAAYQSAKENGQPVKLPLFHEAEGTDGVST